MHTQSFRSALIVMFFATLLCTACSSNKVKELSQLELAQQLVRDQQNQARDTGVDEPPPFKIHFIQSDKAVLGKAMEVEFEVVALKMHPQITVLFEAGEGLEFTRRWWIFKQASIERDMKDVKEDKIYRQKVSMIPAADGLHKLNIYVLYDDDKEQKAHLHTVNIAIGDPLRDEANKRIEL